MQPRTTNFRDPFRWLGTRTHIWLLATPGGFFINTDSWSQRQTCSVRFFSGAAWVILTCSPGLKVPRLDPSRAASQPFQGLWPWVLPRCASHLAPGSMTQLYQQRAVLAQSFPKHLSLALSFSSCRTALFRDFSPFLK